MDTLRYNLISEKAKIKSVFTKEGDGFLHGRVIKKMPNNDVNIAGGKYTTCNEEHPHFYLALTKAKLIPGKKIVTGPAYLVMEDVPIYFLG
jgi:lipopolysaccharide assembly outer membrane protein LptD (OstA)